MAKRIYLSPPHLSGLERDFVLSALASNWIAPTGPDVDAFEREFAAVTRCGHAAALNSGTAALHLALRVAGVERGDSVLVSTLTFVATGSVVRYLGARPIFIDSEPRSWNMDPALLEATLHDLSRVGRLPRAVVVVHLFGQCADLTPIMTACARYRVPIIEDAAEALGAHYHGRSAGSFGLLGAFSFNGNKMITTSGGGMLVSTHEGLIDRARFLASQARDPAAHYEHSELGYNYRLSNILAALGRAQLQFLEERVAARRRVTRIYRQQLSELPGLRVQQEMPWGRHARWLTCITVDSREAGVDRHELWRALQAADIEARPLWKPLHMQPLFARCPAVGGHIAEELFNNGLCLPSGSGLTDAELDRVIAVIKRTFARGPRVATPQLEIMAH